MNAQNVLNAENVAALLANYGNTEETSKRLKFLEDGNIGVVEIAGEAFRVPADVMGAKLLYLLDTELKTTAGGMAKYREKMQALEQGRLFLRGGKSELVIPTSTQKVITPDDYRSNVFRANMRRENAESVESVILSYLLLDKTKAKKDDLLTLLDTLAEVFYPQEKRAEYEAQSEQYAKDMQAFESLLNAGYRDISRVDDKGLLSAKIGFAEWQAGASKILMDSGYKPEGMPVPDMENFTFTLLFRKEEKKETATAATAEAAE